MLHSGNDVITVVVQSWKGRGLLVTEFLIFNIMEGAVLYCINFQ